MKSKSIKITIPQEIKLSSQEVLILMVLGDIDTSETISLRDKGLMDNTGLTKLGYQAVEEIAENNYKF